jgi:Ca-activated chloride channel family protein
MRVPIGLVCVALLGLAPWVQVGAQESLPPSFRSGVDLVSVSAVVRDGRGRLVPELTREDFRVLDGGESRPIIDFWSNGTAAVSVGILLDVSGSMGVGSKMKDARTTANHLLARLRAGEGEDESAIFAFDTQLRVLEPFSSERRHLADTRSDVHPFGATSLYDAIAETARRLADRPTTHRAVVVLSDGIDTRSRLTGPEVSAIATAIDVPVYLVAVVSPLDHPDAPTATGDAAEGAGRLRDLARWTGGGVHFASTPKEGSRAMTELLNELRHQYVLAFEASPQSGWRLIEVRVDDRRVQTRSAYQATP